MKQAGFTLVELLVVIIVMGVLLTIGTLNLRNGQIDSRDNERAADVENIMRSLESSYTRNTGEYPITTAVSSASAIASTLPDLGKNSYRAPGVTAGSSVVAATNTTQTASGILPAPSTSQYVYQPLASDGTLCTTAAQECRSYNIYYRSERTNTVMMQRGKYQ